MNYILGGKLTDHVAIRSRRGEGRLHNYIIGNILGGKLGQFWGKLGGSFPCAPLLR